MSEHFIRSEEENSPGSHELKEENSKLPVAKKSGKRGRKPSKIDMKAKLERSRQSARECRARKKLRYQYLEELVSSRERAVMTLRDELEMCKKWCADLHKGETPDGFLKFVEQEKLRSSKNPSTSSVSASTDNEEDGDIDSENSD